MGIIETWVTATVALVAGFVSLVELTAYLVVRDALEKRRT